MRFRGELVKMKMIEGYTKKEMENAYRKYLQSCLEDEGFDITHIEDFETWVDVEKDSLTWLESL